MPTKPAWDLPTIPIARSETPNEQRARRAEGARARAAIRIRTDAEGRARAALTRHRETCQRIKDDSEWRATHKPPTRDQLEALRGMFPSLKGKRKT